MTKKSSGDFTSDRLSLLKSRLKVAKTWSKKAHDAWKKWIAEYEIEDIGDTEEIRDKVRIGYIFRKVESDLPSIFDDQPELFIKGRSPKLRALDPWFEGAYDYLWDIQNLDEKIEDAGLYFILLGMGFIESPWVTKTKKVYEPILNPDGSQVLDEKGQPAFKEYDVPIVDNPLASVPDPFKLYFSPETKFAPRLDYEHCPYYFEELVMTPEEIKAKFGKEVEANETLKLDDVEMDDELDKASGLVKDDFKRVTVYKYIGCLPENLAVKGSEWSYDKDYQIFFTANEELKAEESPYEVKPLFVVGNYGLANKFWKFGDAKHLLPLVRELEQYRTQILKHTRKMANPKALVNTAANVDEEAFRDPNVGRVVKWSGSVPPAYLSPANLGNEVEVGVQMVRTDLEKTAGTFDLENGGSQSQVRTPRGIQVYAEAADRNIRRKRKKIARFIREIIIFQFQQLAQNWRAEDNHTLPVGEEDRPVPPEVLSVFGDPALLGKLDVEVESLSVNHVQMRQDALELWSLARQDPTIFKLPEVAKFVLQTGFNLRDGDRFLLSDAERAQMGQRQPEPPKVSVAIKADATTPPGAALLENEGLLPPGQAQQAVIDNQTVQQAAKVAQTNQQLMSSQPVSVVQQGGANGSNQPSLA